MVSRDRFAMVIGLLAIVLASMAFASGPGADDYTVSLLGADEESRLVAGWFEYCPAAAGPACPGCVQPTTCTLGVNANGSPKCTPAGGSNGCSAPKPIKFCKGTLNPYSVCPAAATCAVSQVQGACVITFTNGLATGCALPAGACAAGGTSACTGC